MFTQELFKKIFKAYDIRGVYPTQVNEDLYREFGKAFVHVLGCKNVAIGRDARLSSPALFQALTEGITSQGADVMDLGPITSDMLYFASATYGYDAGMMITASHNPKEYNGIKSCLKNAAPFPTKDGGEYGRIQELLLSRHAFPTVDTPGTCTSKDIHGPWIDHLHTFFDKEAVSPMHIVIDAGNGIAGPFVEQLMATLPQLTITPLYFEPDGNFPHHPASPIEEENLQDLKRTMKEVDADLGMAFDGDGDRVFLVDDQGHTLSGTEATAMIASMLLKKHGKGTILYNAICGKIVPETVTALGGTAIRVPVGHTFIKQAMEEHQALFAGEHSGHYFFKENWNADSGLIMAVILLEMISRSGSNLATLRKAFGKYVANEETNFTVTDIPAMLRTVEARYTHLPMDHLDGLTIYGETWWCNIRASNTEPLLRLNIEANDTHILEEKTREFHQLLTATE